MRGLQQSFLSDSERKLAGNLPEKIVQFGEGNFLRGFVDWMVHQLNKKGLFQGRIAAIQPTPHGKVVPKLQAQDGLYTCILRGIENGRNVEQIELVSSISRGINPYEQWSEVLQLAESPDIKFVFSNTTEAGITYWKEPNVADKSPLSFPGKLTAFLYHRFKVLGDGKETGLKIFPCELVENNGDLLKEIVLRIADDWGLPVSFTQWVERSNRFCNTLVDRIVTGYPKDEADVYNEQLGYVDQLLTVGEPYHLFVIEADEETARAIPFHEAGLNVHWAKVKPFRDMKVRMLNGAHTLMVPVAFLCGKDTVFETMQDDLLRRWVEKGIDEEILPMVDGNTDVSWSYRESVIERFRNPFTKHYLLDIALNSFAKFKTRLLPTLLETVEKEQRLPTIIPFSLAALLILYQGSKSGENTLACTRDGQNYTVREQAETISFLAEAWSAYQGEEKQLQDVIETILRQESLWGQNLFEIPGLAEKVHRYVTLIAQRGMRNAVKQLVEGEALHEEISR
ncbi:tagaturonate reductase [Brevibacillus migulae]|uniref:tagaturonate reductase n=1 Tax=Brevibacillus migulae TaxID=1644114 RepID=UPI00106EF716|nr:tagaturonate reductase [Brevibacillus migulae]